eukprot:749858-Hanusia_phi.AAC.4
MGRVIPSGVLSGPPTRTLQPGVRVYHPLPAPSSSLPPYASPSLPALLFQLEVPPSSLHSDLCFLRT